MRSPDTTEDICLDPSLTIRRVGEFTGVPQQITVDKNHVQYSIGDGAIVSETIELTPEQSSQLAELCSRIASDNTLPTLSEETVHTGHGDQITFAGKRFWVDEGTQSAYKPIDRIVKFGITAAAPLHEVFVYQPPMHVASE